MSSLHKAPKPYSLQLAERIHNTTGKEHLPRICGGGLLLEILWHRIVEQRILKTPTPAVRKALLRAVVTWPTIYAVTASSLAWAAWRVDQAARAEKGNNQRHL